MIEMKFDLIKYYWWTTEFNGLILIEMVPDYV